MVEYFACATLTPLAGMLAMIMLRTLHKDIAAYNLQYEKVGRCRRPASCSSPPGQQRIAHGTQRQGLNPTWTTAGGWRHNLKPGVEVTRDRSMRS